MNNITGIKESLNVTGVTELLANSSKDTKEEISLKEKDVDTLLREYYDEYDMDKLLLREYFEIMTDTMKKSNIISLVGVILTAAAFIPLAASYIKFPSWRHQEHNRIFIHFILAVTINNLMFFRYIVYEDGSIMQNDTVSFILKSVDYYTQYLICIWMFMLIFCMRKMLVQVIITKKIYPTYSYYVIYLLSLAFIAIYNDTTAILCSLIFTITVLGINSVIYVNIIITVIRKSKQSIALARRRNNILNLVIRFIILYTLVSTQAVLHTIMSFTLFHLNNKVNNEEMSDSFEEVYSYMITVSKVILYSASFTRIPTSFCIIYCLFGNKNTRVMWKNYFERCRKRRLSVNTETELHSY